MDEKSLREQWEKTLGSGDWSTLSASATFKPPAGEDEDTALQDGAALFLPTSTLSGGGTLSGEGGGTLSGSTVDGGGATLSDGGTIESGGTLSDDGTMDSPATAGLGVSTGGPALANFELVDELGRGGMGVVYRARQASLKREVAVKRVLPGQASQSSREKFVSEALVTGVLDHPNIVPVHELGQTPEGDVFLAMKLVGGTSWQDLLHPKTDAHRNKAPAFDREGHIGILLNVCNAMAYAHTRGIVHRDLKPENVMVGEFGEVLVMDWGIALDVREKAEEDRRAPHKSTVHAPAGTPSYMAPEMAEGRGADIGPWTDVYLLGAMLHEVVTGAPPHTGGSLMAVLLAASESAPKTYGPDVPEALQEVLRRSMARDTAERYPDVVSLQEALRTYLRNRESMVISERADREMASLLSAGQAQSEADRNALYARYAKAVARYEQALELWEGNDGARSGVRKARLAYGSAALSLGDLGLAEAQVAPLPPADPEVAALVQRIAAERKRREGAARTARLLKGGLIGAAVVIIAGLLVGYFLVDQQRKKAEEQKVEAQTQRDRAEAANAETARQRDLALAAQENEKAQRQAAEKAQAHALVQEREARHQLGVTQLLNLRKFVDEKRWFSAVMLANRAVGFTPGPGGVPDGVDPSLFEGNLKPGTIEYAKAQWVLRTSPRFFSVWRTPSVRHHSNTISQIAIDDKSRFIATSCGAELKLWNARTGDLIHELKGHYREIDTIGFSPDGRRLASAADDATLRVWDAGSGTQLACFEGLPSTPRTLAMSPDGSLVAWTDRDQALHAWVFEGKAGPVKLLDTSVTAFNFDPAGTSEMVVLQGGSLKRVDRNGAESALPFETPKDTLDIICSDDGNVLAVRTKDSSVHVLEMANGRERSVIGPLDIEIKSMGFFPGARELLVFGGEDDWSGEARLFDAATGKLKEGSVKKLGRSVGTVLSRDSRILVWKSGGGAETPDATLNVMDLSTGKNLYTPLGHGYNVESIWFPKEGPYVSTDGKLWDIRDGTLAADGSAGWVAGRVKRLYAQFNSASMKMSIFRDTGDGGKGELIREVPLEKYRPHNFAHPIAYSPDQTKAAICSGSKVVLVDLIGGAEPKHLGYHGQEATAVAFSPDGSLLASGGRNYRVFLWDANTGAELAAFKDHSDIVWDLDVHPSGKWMSSASSDGTLRIWDVERKRLYKTIEGQHYSFNSAAFSPRGDLITAPGALDGTFRLWETRTWSLVAVLEGHLDGVTELGFDATGRWIATGSDDWTARLWDVGGGYPRSLIVGDPERNSVFRCHGGGRYLQAGKLWVDLKALAVVKAMRGNYHVTKGSAQLVSIVGAKVYRYDAAARKDLDELDISLSGKKAFVSHADIPGDGKTAVALHASNQLVSISLESGEAKEILDKAFPENCHFLGCAPGTPHVLIGGEKTLFLVDCAKGAIREIFQRRRPVYRWADTIVKSPDGRWFAIADGNDIQLIDVEKGTSRFLEGAHKNRVSSLRFNPNGRLLASGGIDRRLILWKLPDGRQTSLEGHLGDVTVGGFCADGFRLVSSDDQGRVIVWDTRKSDMLACRDTSDGRTCHWRLHPDGNRLIAYGGDAGVRLIPFLDPPDLTPYLELGAFEGLEFKLTNTSKNLYSKRNSWNPLLKAAWQRK